MFRCANNILLHCRICSQMWGQDAKPIELPMEFPDSQPIFEPWPIEVPDATPPSGKPKVPVFGACMCLLNMCTYVAASAPTKAADGKLTTADPAADEDAFNEVPL